PYWFKNIDEVSHESGRPLSEPESRQNASPGAIKILVGNKCDADQSLRVVDTDQGRAMATRLDVPFFECSCKHNLNVVAIFTELCHRIHDHLEKNVSATGARAQPHHWPVSFVAGESLQLRGPTEQCRYHQTAGGQ